MNEAIVWSSAAALLSVMIGVLTIISWGDRRMVLRREFQEHTAALAEHRAQIKERLAVIEEAAERTAEEIGGIQVSLARIETRLGKGKP